MSAKNYLASYPNIRALNDSLQCSLGEMNNLARNRLASIALLDEILPTLNIDARPSLIALANDLFSKDIKKINASMCELIAFAWLKDKGLLSEENIGYPLDWPTDDPPFEGVLCCGGTELAFDVKDGSGSGYRLLLEVLSKVLADEARAQSVKVPSLDVELNAPTGQRWFEKNFMHIVKPFRESLKSQGFVLGRRKFLAGSGTVLVCLGCSAGGSISGLAETASFIASQVLSHAIDKASKLPLTGAHNFLLIYVKRPHMGDSDFKKYTMLKVFDFLAGMAELLPSLASVLFISFEFIGTNDNIPNTILWDRKGSLAGIMDGIVCQNYTAISTLMPLLGHSI